MQLLASEYMDQFGWGGQLGLRVGYGLAGTRLGPMAGEDPSVL